MYNEIMENNLPTMFKVVLRNGGQSRTLFYPATDRFEASLQACQDNPGFAPETIEEITQYTVPTMDGRDSETERHDRALTRGYNQPVYKTTSNWAAL